MLISCLGVTGDFLQTSYQRFPPGFHLWPTAVMGPGQLISKIPRVGIVVNSPPLPLFPVPGHLLSVPSTQGTQRTWCCSQLLFQRPVNMFNLYFFLHQGKMIILIITMYYVKSWLIGKDPDAGRDWGQEEMGMTEDEMAGWHHRLDGHEFEWTPGVGDGQGGLACCDSWCRKELDTTERLNRTLYITNTFIYQFGNSSKFGF